MTQKTKNDSNVLKHINPLEFVKKDFSSHFQELVNSEAFNYEFINKFKKKDDLLTNQDDVDMFFDENIEKNGEEKNTNKQINLKNPSNLKNHMKKNKNDLSAVYGNKLNINMNNSNVSSETLNNSRLLNTTANNPSNRNSLNQKIYTNRYSSLGTNLSNNNKDKENNNIIQRIEDLNEKEILEKNFKNLEKEENDCCIEDDDFDGPHIKLNNEDSDMFVSEVRKNVNKKQVNIKNNSDKNENDKNHIKVENSQMDKNNVKMEKANEIKETDINKIRSFYNLAEKPTNCLNINNSNTNSNNAPNFDLNKKSNNVSILSFINRGNKKPNNNSLDLDSLSDASESHDMNPKNKLINNNKNGKRKNLSNQNELIKKGINKKKKPSFK